ncbi:hypothetical protein [Pseudomonas baetica]|uniref:hypothetical protein n=1 Tax=Pseudomonas baetica TaxID=674054 RepID=UPI0024068077|nr:hypothetical protein [Pseudomonas baetica]MDF9779036.1 hypothetical protein [Pseudomonas baetica]
MNEPMPPLIKKMVLCNLAYYVCMLILIALAVLSFSYMLFDWDIGYTKIFGTTLWPAVITSGVVTTALSAAYHSAHHFHKGHLIFEDTTPLQNDKTRRNRA